MLLALLRSCATQYKVTDVTHLDVNTSPSVLSWRSVKDAAKLQGCSWPAKSYCSTSGNFLFFCQTIIACFCKRLRFISKYLLWKFGHTDFCIYLMHLGWQIWHISNDMCWFHCYSDPCTFVLAWLLPVCWVYMMLIVRVCLKLAVESQTI